MTAARKQSSTGIYHVMSRGVEKRNIFMDQSDYRRFLAILGEAKRKFGFLLFAWCLMPNHIHLLIQEKDECLSDAMQFIKGSYVKYFNKKHMRIGPLFQGRFKSCPVEDEGYLLTLVAYIHDNPVKGGFGSLGSYPWSSYRDYARPGAKDLTDTSFVNEIMGEEGVAPNVGQLTYLPNLFNEDGLLDPHLEVDAEVALVLLGYGDTDLAEAPKVERNEAIGQLKKQGYSMREIAQAVGVNASTVSRVCRCSVE